MNKELPHSLEAEQSVIGAMFLSKYALQKACETLKEENFYYDKNSKIFSVIKEMTNNGVPLDITTITSELNNKKILKEIGGVEYLTEVLDSVPTAANIDYYLKIVEEASILRNLIHEATDIVTLGYESKENINETLDRAESKILNVIRNRKSSEFKTITEVLTKTQENLEKLASNKKDITGLSTGWHDFDKLTSGLHENELIIIAARPAMGKTAFALNLAVNAAINSKKSVAVFNLEMGAEQVVSRMISSVGQIEMQKLRNGKLLNEDWKRVNEAMSQLADAKIYIDDTPGVTISDIRSKCRRLASTTNDLGLIVIDYLQLIQGGSRYAGNRQQEVSDISRMLKTMALELNVPVVALAQLSRTVEMREDKRPILSDLRESGSIEQDADIVGFLYRDDYYDKEARNDNFISESELIIRKHRNGPTATIDLLFKRNTSTFLNYKKEAKKEGVVD